MCIPLFSGIDAEAQLKAIQPSVHCNYEGLHPACKDLSEVSCMADLAYVAPGTPDKSITQAKWSQSCGISQIPWVARIAGGHWL